MRTVWLSPLSFVSGVPSASINNPTGVAADEQHTTVTRRGAGGSGTVRVYLPLAIGAGSVISRLRLAYRINREIATNRSAITRIRLTEVGSSGTVAVRHDDTTRLESTVVATHNSDVPDFAASGAVRVELDCALDGRDAVVPIAVGIDCTEPATAAVAGMFNVRDYGAKANGTDDSDAFERTLKALAAFGGVTDGFNRSGLVFIPAGEYTLLKPLRLEFPVILQGAGERGTFLKFPAGSAGIIVDLRFNDPAIGGSSGYAAIATSTVIRDLNVWSPEQHTPGAPSPIPEDAAPQETFSGIVLHARARVENVSVQGFRHDGIHINASFGASEEINADCWQAQNCFVANNGRHGMFVSGGDANTGLALGVHAQVNTRWGIYDQSLLGNTYVGCVTDANGHLSAGSSDPVTTAGGGYCTTNAAARHVLLGCYAERDQTNRIIYPTMIVGGDNQGHGIEYDPRSQWDPVVIHNEGEARMVHLDVPGMLSRRIKRMTHIATAGPQPINFADAIVLASSGTVELVLGLPAPSEIRASHQHVIKKVDGGAPVRLVAQADGGAPPTIDGNMSLELAAQGSHVSVLFDGDNWQVVSKG